MVLALLAFLPVAGLVLVVDLGIGCCGPPWSCSCSLG